MKKSGFALPAVLVALAALAAQTSKASLPGLYINGDPESSAGATWIYHDSVGGVVYDLRGILIKPPGLGPFPAVILNHGTGGSAATYGRPAGDTMASWGYASIAVNYTHASPSEPCGSPGQCESADLGASAANVLRGMKAREILASLPYVNGACIMAFGHSRGAFVTTALLAAFPDKFTAAAHTAGGAAPVAAFSAPSVAQAKKITKPYLIHHGDADNTVPLALDSLLNAAFDETGVTHEFDVYPGFDHARIAYDPLMTSRTRAWFAKYGCPTGAGVGGLRGAPGSRGRGGAVEEGFALASRCNVYALDGRLEFTGSGKEAEAYLHGPRAKAGLRILQVTSAGAGPTRKLLVK